ncbi:MAG TPA: HepT-like ribonuclease domain-containing protein [Anaeromyxobacter sp.]|nr:HepT-like ribonuclease domain-containing protein [Anaeromyxobacter sp.]
MRNVLAHAYFGGSLKVVWDTATTQVEDLEKAVRSLLE